MKKIYSIIIVAFLISTISKAQLTLTKAANEPAIGNTDIRKGYDSASVLPKNTGTNQVWNFSTLLSNTVTEIASYTTVASASSGTAYPAATMTEFNGVNSNDFIKVTATNYEFLGTNNPNTVLNYTNSAIFATWPISMGYSGSDNFSGYAAITTLTGSAIGNIATNATGTGTLQLPGGLTFTNVLQVQLTTTLNLNLAGGTITATVVGRQYMYYHGSQKFPILTVNYNRTTGSFSAFTVDIRVNSAVLTNINETLSDNDLNFYPNPSNGLMNIHLKHQENCSIEIIDLLGQSVFEEEVISEDQVLDLRSFQNGIYTLKVSGKGRTLYNHKIIIQK